MPTEEERPTAQAHQDVRDRMAISDVLIRFTCAIDSRDWMAYRSCFADCIEIDYRSLIGGDVLSESGDAWTERARQSFAGFEATQHFISNHACELNGDRATCSTYVCAEHFVAAGSAQEFWTMGGVYRTEFERAVTGWRIDALKLDVRWSRGNPGIFELAAKSAHGG